MKTRNFQIIDLPGLRLNDVFIVSGVEKNQMESSTKFLSDPLTVVKGIYVGELQHSGYKVMDYALRHYFEITRGFIQ